MRNSMLFLLLAHFLLIAVPASAKPFSADIDGMHIEITQPWYLFTHVLTQNTPERIFFSLREGNKKDGWDITGEGTVYAYPAVKKTPFPAPDALKRMKPEELQAFVLKLDTTYTKFSAPKKDLKLVDINGFAAIAYRAEAPGNERVPEPSYDFLYYFPLQERLVVLSAYVYGSKDSARVLENICASFSPATTSGQPQSHSQLPAAMNRIYGDGMHLDVPGTWEMLMTGSAEDDRLWADAVKYSGDDDFIAKTSVLSPVAASSPIGGDPIRRLYDSGEDDPLAFYALGTRAPMENGRVLRTEQVMVNNFPAALTVVAGEVEDKEVVVELRDIRIGDMLVTMATGYRVPLPKGVRGELEAIYASFSYGQ